MNNEEKDSFFDDEDVHPEDAGSQDSFFEASDISPEDRNAMASFMGTGQENIGQGEAFLKGTQQGTTLGLSDELAGLAGAAGYASGLPTTPSRDQLLDAYRQAQQEDLARIKMSQEQHPGTTMAGEFAGGALLPIPGGALGSTIEKDALTQALGKGTQFAKPIAPTLAEKATMGTITGAGMGSIAGPAMNDTNYINEPGQLPIDMATGALGGATVGAVAPVALAPVELAAKGAVKLGEEAADFALQSPMAEYMKTAFKAGQEGRKIATKAGRAEVGKTARDLNRKFVDELQTIQNDLGNGYKKVLSGMDKSGTTFETKIDDAIKKVQDIKNTQRIDEGTLKEATDLEQLLLDYRHGRATTPGGERPNLEPEMTGSQVKELASNLRNKIDSGQIKEYRTKQATNDFASSLKKTLQEKPEYKQLDKDFATVKSVTERLKIDPKNDNDEVMVDKLTSMFSELGKATKSADKATAIMDETLNKLEPIRPGIRQRFKPRLEKMAAEMEASQAAVTRPYIYGPAVRAAGAAGTLVKKSPEQLKNAGNKLMNNSDPILKKLGAQLHKMGTQDNKGRQATMFTIMQDPNARNKLGIDIKKETEDENNEQRSK